MSISARGPWFDFNKKSGDTKGAIGLGTPEAHADEKAEQKRLNLNYGLTPPWSKHGLNWSPSKVQKLDLEHA